MENIRFYRLQDKITEIVIRCQHELKEITTAMELLAISHNAITEYQNNPLFHAKVNLIVTHIMNAIREELGDNYENKIPNKM